jgi:hypothetical protein
LALIHLHIYDDRVIRSQRLLKNRFQLFLLRHAEAFSAVEFGEFGEVGDEKLNADDAAVGDLV